MFNKKKAIALVGMALIANACSNADAGKSDNAKGTAKKEEKAIAKIHYSRINKDYDNSSVWAWEDAVDLLAWPEGYKKSAMDDFGAVFDIPLDEDPKKVGFLFVDYQTGEKDGGDRYFQLDKTKEVWVMEGSNIEYYSTPDPLEADEVRIHYKRGDGSYEPWTLWVWNDVDVDLSAGWPNGIQSLGETSYGAYYDVKVTGNSIGIKPANVTDGSGDNGDRNFKKLDKYRELFINDEGDNVYVGPNMDLPDGIEKAEILSKDTIKLTFSNMDTLDESTVTITNKMGETVEMMAASRDGNNLIVKVGEIKDENLPYSIKYDDYNINAKKGIAYIDTMYAYDGDDLGATYMNGGAILKLWTPSASKVEVDLYDKDENLVKSLPLAKGDKAVWSVVLNKSNTGIADLNGYFYQYRVTNNGKEKKVLDPYAKSLAEFRVNTSASNKNKVDSVGKAAIINPKLIEKVKSYADIDGYNKKTDAVIYEVHVRDFTSQEGLSLDSTFGTFDAFKEKLDYIKSLGVTHVQLLPVMASYFGDESKNAIRETEYKSGNSIYNWGYDPHSYFAVDGMYSEDSKNPLERMNELKELINAVHDAGMGVILDVVYNHTAQLSLLEDIVPSYYSYLKADGSPKDSFGGSLVGTTHAMTRKLIVDSVKYFTEEFKVDGYRFDMMGAMDADTVGLAYKEAAKLNPKTLFLGEGWRTYSGDDGISAKPADQDWMKDTDNVAVFSDEIRNELKSGFGSEGEKRFITGGARNISTIFNNIIGEPGNFKADSPVDVVQYIAAHDNLTLHDVIAHSSRLSSVTDEEEIQKRIRLGNTIILTSQGVAFLHAGQEYGRTKKWNADKMPSQKYTLVDETKEVFIHDSYDSSDVINAFDWNAVADGGRGHDTMEYTKGLIELRRSTDAFRLGDAAKVEANVKLLYPSKTKSDVIISYSAKATNGDTYYVFVNGDKKARTFNIGMDLTGGEVIVDAAHAGVDAIANPTGVKVGKDMVEVEGLSSVVIRVK